MSTPRQHTKQRPKTELRTAGRFLVLVLIDRAIVALGKRCGLEAFRDALPNERANVFQIIHEALQ